MSELSSAPPIIHIGTHDAAPRVTLIKTDQQEMQALWPVDPAAIGNMAAIDQIEIARPSAAFIAELHRDPNVRLWGIHAGEEGEERLVGFATLSPVTDKEQNIGIAILDPAAQGRGIGPRVVLGIATCAFERTGCELLYADPLETNYASMRAFEKNGFIRRDNGATAMHIRPQDWRTQWVLPKSIESALSAEPKLSPAATARALTTHRVLREVIGVSFGK